MNCLLLWVSKLQTQIALSTVESEYIALSHSMRDLIAIRGVIQEINKCVFNGTLDEPNLNTHSRTFAPIPQSVVHEDKSAYLKFATMTKMSSRTKHISVLYQFFRSKVENLEVKVVAIDTNNQKGDQFTKVLSEPKFVKDRQSLM